MSDRDEREDYMVQQQAREVWMESYSQDRILLQRGDRAKRKGETTVRQDNPKRRNTPPDHSHTTPAAVSPERKPQ